jgi:hypothetical protein
MPETNPSDHFCIPAPLAFSPSLDDEQLRAHFRHYMLCDWNPAEMNLFLDELVRRGDLEATTDKGILLLETDRARATALLEKSAARGDPRARRTLDALRPDS